MDKSHSPHLTSWVGSAQRPGTDFPIQNLPFGVFILRGTTPLPRVGIAIGSEILDIASCLHDDFFNGPAAVAAQACEQPTLNALMALDRRHWTALRGRVSELLDAHHPHAGKLKKKVSNSLVAMSSVRLLLPAVIGDYTDFYASLEHATNVGTMFRPGNPLLPNYKYVPVGYHGRASSIVVSGTDIRRPMGQVRGEGSEIPEFQPTRMLDYETEVGLFAGCGNTLGHPIPIREAEAHMFGLCLVNDWSARDIQKWEYQPLGPFLGKNFATTISPWVVTADALEPFRVPAMKRPQTDPQPLAYLTSPQDQLRGAIELFVDVFLQSERMRRSRLPFFRLSRGRLRGMYWTFSQLLAHHTSNGCNLRPGDLLASGTLSGTARDSRGSLLELTWQGEQPVALPGGERRRFLEDGDEVLLQAFCARRGFRRIGLGECRGKILPADGGPI